MLCCLRQYFIDELLNVGTAFVLLLPVSFSLIALCGFYYFYFTKSFLIFFSYCICTYFQPIKSNFELYRIMLFQIISLITPFQLLLEFQKQFISRVSAITCEPTEISVTGTLPLLVKTKQKKMKMCLFIYFILFWSKCIVCEKFWNITIFVWH